MSAAILLQSKIGRLRQVKPVSKFHHAGKHSGTHAIGEEIRVAGLDDGAAQVVVTGIGCVVPAFLAKKKCPAGPLKAIRLDVEGFVWIQAILQSRECDDGFERRTRLIILEGRAVLLET